MGKILLAAAGLFLLFLSIRRFFQCLLYRMVLWTASSSASTTHNPFPPLTNLSSSFKTHSWVYYQYQGFSQIPSATAVEVPVVASFYSLFFAEVPPTSA